MRDSKLDASRVIACRSDADLFELDADIQVIGGPGGGCTLRATRVPDELEARRDLIKRVRGGEHLELSLMARVFRQKDGKPNRRFLRHADESLPTLAASYVRMPMLVDHNTYEQSARIGTVLASELYEQGDGWKGLRQQLHIVKPDAVVSVLDGTLDRFSIGWIKNGPVICSVHRTPALGRGACPCWPGDVVEMDGVQRTVEFEFHGAEGTEVSAVNVPAVKGTKIEDIRTALALELGLDVSLSREPSSKEIVMLTRLAAAMGLATLTAAEEDRAVQVYQQERTARLAAEQERDTANARIKQLETELSSTKTAGTKAAIDTAIEGAYRDGKLRYGRDSEGTATPSRFEPMLRKLAASEGLEALRAEIAGMPKVVPVGENALAGEDPIPRRGRGTIPDSALDSVARQLGLEAKDFADATQEG